MKSKIVLLGIVLLLSTTALGVAPLGKPTAGLQQGQWRIGFDYSHSEIDNLELEWKSPLAPAFKLKEKVDDFKSDLYLARIGIGATDNWEVYGLLGVADSEGEIFGVNLDGGAFFSGGFGTKYTFLNGEKLSWGALYQMRWTQGDDDVTINASGIGLGTIRVEAESNWYEIIIALGPTYDMGSWRIYGGPLLFIMDGDIDIELSSVKVLEADIDKDTELGGYGGVEIDLSSRSSLYGEFGFTSDAWVLGSGINWKF
ncbi:MAG: hypothetical protein ACYTFM_06850 [Planctomycetota bacterium]